MHTIHLPESVPTASGYRVTAVRDNAGSLEYCISRINPTNQAVESHWGKPVELSYLEQAEVFLEIIRTYGRRPGERTINRVLTTVRNTIRR